MPCGKTKHDTLCWECDKASGKCSWSKNFQPVEGLKAIPTKIFQYTMGAGGKQRAYYTDSFDVYECPEFEPLKMTDLKICDDGKRMILAEVERIETVERNRKALLERIKRMLFVEHKSVPIVADLTGISERHLYRIKREMERGK